MSAANARLIKSVLSVIAIALIGGCASTQTFRVQAPGQSDSMIPKSHTLVATCLHIAFGGPLPHGAAVAIPIAGKPFEYLTVGVEYDSHGKFIGSQALHAAPDKPTCMNEAKDVLHTNYKGGNVKAGNSLLLYCMPIPSLEKDSSKDGGIL